ncbi:oligosaccharide flippase family protein [Enterococcus faecium]|uniref:oligosaccharide flippase family protein n=1 Tax=Enterococcus faecium TaxID=1352 RepID=UPI0023B27FA1|nr:oligosaccharide flippase family protein [Enterococcus faecium]
MKRKLLTNIFYQGGYQILIIILPIITTPVITSRLSPDSTGTFKYIGSIAQYFILIAGLGLGDYGVREIAKVCTDRDRLSKKFWEIQLFNLYFSLGTFFIYCFGIFFTSEKLLFSIYGITVFSAVIDISWFFSGLEDFKKITLRNLILKISSFVAIVIFVKNDNDLWIYFLINALSIFLGQVILWVNINRYIDFVKISRKDIWQHFKPALQLFLAKISLVLYNTTSSFLLGILSSMSNVGLYTYSSNLISIASSVLSATNLVMIPRMTSIYMSNTNDDEEMLAIFKKMIMIQLYFTIAITFGIFATNVKLIGWFIDEKYKAIEPFVYLFAPSISFQIMQMSVATMWLIPKNEMKEYNTSVLVGGIICIVINFITIPFIGVYGSILAITVAYIFVCIKRFRFMYQNTAFRFDWQQIGLNILCGLIMYILVVYLTKHMPSAISTTGIQVLIGGSVYLGLTTLLKANPAIFLLNPKMNFLKKKERR